MGLGGALDLRTLAPVSTPPQTTDARSSWKTPVWIVHAVWLIAVAIGCYVLRDALVPASIKAAAGQSPFTGYAIGFGYLVYLLTATFCVLAGSEWVTTAIRVCIIHIATLVLAACVIGGALAFMSLQAS